MEHDRPELERLKAGVNCAALLEHGSPPWQLDRWESTRRCRKYRRGPGEIVLVTHAGRGWWDPCSTARGDAIALLRHLEPSLGFPEACRQLRAFIGIGAANTPGASPCLGWPPSTRWRQRDVPRSGSPAWRYLTQQRGLPARVIHAAIAADGLREGPAGSAWFAHRDHADGLTGIEMRGPAYRGFSRGGGKVLFRLQGGPGPCPRLAVTEAATDALSLAALEGLRANTLYLATAGGIGPATEAALSQLLRARSCHSKAVLIAATDADPAGDRHADQLSRLAAAHATPFLRLRPSSGKDWNEILTSRGEKKG